MVLLKDGRGEPLSVGRKTRIVPAAIKRALWARDKGCTFPGCGRRRFVEAHHVVHWSAGGETSLQNCLLLCSAHHALVHEHGFTIEKDYQDRWFFRRPDGRVVPACGYRPEDITDDDVETAGEYFDGHAPAEAAHVSAEAPITSAGGYALNETSTEAGMVKEPPAKGLSLCGTVRNDRGHYPLIRSRERLH